MLARRRRRSYTTFQVRTEIRITEGLLWSESPADIRVSGTTVKEDRFLSRTKVHIALTKEILLNVTEPLYSQIGRFVAVGRDKQLLLIVLS